MIRYRFGRDDLLRTRFALSPLFEVVWSAHILRRPARAPLHRPWVADARECLAGVDWSLLDWLANGYGEGIALGPDGRTAWVSNVGMVVLL